MTDAQRAFWIDLLALAGRSRYPGKIYAGEVGGKLLGYPLNKFQALMMQPLDIMETLQLFEKTDKIKLTITHEEPTKLVMVELLNWEKYQSEYQRQKKYRKRLQGNDKRSYVKGDKKSYAKGNKTEGEVEVEGEVEKRQRKHSAAVAATIALAFEALREGCVPFGSDRFKVIWAEEYELRMMAGAPVVLWTDTMEKAIQRCQKLKVTVPGRFFTIKREIEKVEVQNDYRKKTPL